MLADRRDELGHARTEVSADAVAALDCPDSIGESLCGVEHLRVSDGVVAYRPVARIRPVLSMISMVAERSCGSIPTMTVIGVPPWTAIVVSVREGTASSSLGRPLSSHSPHGTRWKASQLESHTNTDGGQPHEGAPHRAPGQILAGIGS